MAQAQEVKQGCKVSKCESNHAQHFCRLCEEEDTDHFSSECPRSKTLYHGTQVQYFKSISNTGLKESSVGRLGQGVYFVKTYNKAERISRGRRTKDGDPNSVVIECQVYLGKHRYFDGNKCNTAWQEKYDSASTLHPPWCNIKTVFKEYCLKDSSKCIMKTLYMNGVPIKKDAEMSWGEAQRVINQLTPDATAEDFNRAVERIKMISLPTEQPSTKRTLGQDEPFSVMWVLNRWYVFVKTLLTLFYIGNSIWSAVHLNKQDDRRVTSFVPFIIFLCLQSIANIIYLGFHWKDCLSKPHKVNTYLTLVKPLIALFLEMPMLVSQAFTINSIIDKKQKDFIWDDFNWDIALHIHFVSNLILFVTIDMPYKATKRKLHKVRRWILKAFCLSLLTGLLAFTPVHLTQLGWIWQPHLNDFGGSIIDTNTRNILSFSMVVGAAGLWMWPVTFPMCILVPLRLQWGIFNFGASLKLFLIHFNILNGIWSIIHLYQNNKKAAGTFAFFFSVQAVCNVVLIIYNFYVDYPYKKNERRLMMTFKLVIVVVFEMPMLICQTCAMRDMENLVWSHLNWDVSMHLQFIINAILFVAMDIAYSDNMEEIWAVLPLTIFLIIPFIYAPVYLTLGGWASSAFAPKGVSYFGGTIGNNDNGIVGLLYIPIIFGTFGLYLWTLLAIAIVLTCYDQSKKKE